MGRNLRARLGKCYVERRSLFTGVASAGVNAISGVRDGGQRGQTRTHNVRYRPIQQQQQQSLQTAVNLVEHTS